MSVVLVVALEALIIVTAATALLRAAILMHLLRTRSVLLRAGIAITTHRHWGDHG